MSQKHPMDELFRQKLENHAFEPPMELWGKIDQQRNRRTILLRRGLPVRFLMISGLIITLAVAGWFTWNYLQDGTTEQAGKIATTEVNFAEPDNSTYVEQQSTSPQNEQVEELKSEKDAGRNVSTEQTISDLADPMAELSTITLTDKDEAVRENASKRTAALSEIKDNGVMAEALSEEIPNAFESGLTPESADTESLAINENKVAETLPFDFIKANQTAHLVNRLPLSGKLLSKEDKGSAELPAMETDCPTFVGLPGGLYMDMNASIDLAQRTMTLRNPEMDAYLLEREKSEIPYFAWSAGLHLTALSERGFAVKSGVDYSQINESFNFDGGEVEIITILPGGDTTWEVKNLRIRATNRYQMVDIPLLAGYEHNFSDFSLSVYGGGFLNVKFAKKGNIVSSETMQPVGVTTGEPERFGQLFRERLGFGWYTSFGFAYKLQHGTQIRVEPYFRFYPRSFSAVDNVIDQRYFLTGIKVGVRKRL
jgi:hypothetical protein